MSNEEFVKENLAQGDKTTQPLKAIHYRIMDFIEEKRFSEVNDLMEQLIKVKADNNRLKSVLIITKYWREHELLKDNRKKIIELIEAREGRKLV